MPTARPDTYSAASGGGIYAGAAAPASLPAWRVGQAINEWREVAGSSMAATAPNVVVAKSLTGTTAQSLGNNYGNRLDGYCGVTLDTRNSKLWTVAAGGHGDYWNNELCYQDLMADSPEWAIHFNGSSGNVVNETPTPLAPENARYADGLPASRHTYGRTQFIERHNRAVTTGGSISAPGTGYQDIEAFDITVAAGVNGWDDLYTYPGSEGGIGRETGQGGDSIITATCTKDPDTEVIYTFGRHGLHIVTPSEGGPVDGVPGSGGTYRYVTFAAWAGSVYDKNEGAAAVDTTRRKLFWTHGYDLDSHTMPWVIDLDTETLDTRPTYSGSGAAGLAAVLASCGAVYVPQIDAYLVRGHAAGPAVYKINPVTFEVELLATTGGEDPQIPEQDGSGSQGGLPPNGVYNKWQFAPQLGGVVYLPGASHNTWFLRLF